MNLFFYEIQTNIFDVFDHSQLGFLLATAAHDLLQTVCTTEKLQTSLYNFLVLRVLFEKCFERGKRRRSFSELLDLIQFRLIEFFQYLIFSKEAHDQCFKIYVEFHRISLRSLLGQPMFRFRRGRKLKIRWVRYNERFELIFFRV